MQLFTAAELHEWDQFTIHQENILPADLVERAATAVVSWMTTHFTDQQPVFLFCGPGNNGADGLAIARLLQLQHYPVFVYTLPIVNTSPEWQQQLNRFTETEMQAFTLTGENTFPKIPPAAVVVDALFGSGLNKPITGLAASLIAYLNTVDALRLSIDIPSGLYCDHPALNPGLFSAQNTLTFQCLKRSFLFAETEPYVGNIHVLDIGLSNDYLVKASGNWQLIDEADIQKRWKKRTAFAHKGNFGHALLVAGSEHQTGAAILSTKAALRSGLGKLTTAIPATGATALFATAPEAMQQHAGERCWDQPLDTSAFQAIGIGPGIGTHPATLDQLKSVLTTAAPLILDADALNLLSQLPNWQPLVPPNTLLTPHVKEFDRLFGQHRSDWDRLETARIAADQYRWVIVLKGRFTRIIAPDQPFYFNSSGNPGLAKGGSGDVLTGLLTGLRAQGYAAWDAACMAVYWHGRAADAAARLLGTSALLPSDVTAYLGPVSLNWLTS
jgi:NAD(P)H-hydrate epimerase